MGHCGMSLRQVQREFTQREYEAFLRWKDAKRNDPDLTQMYLMQVARMVNLQRAPQEEWDKFKLWDYRLVFGEPVQETLTEEEEQMRIDMAKGAWGCLVGLRVAPGTSPAEGAGA